MAQWVCRFNSLLSFYLTEPVLPGLFYKDRCPVSKLLVYDVTPESKQLERGSCNFFRMLPQTITIEWFLLGYITLVKSKGPGTLYINFSICVLVSIEYLVLTGNSLVMTTNNNK